MPDDADLFANSQGVKLWAIDPGTTQKLYTVSLDLIGWPLRGEQRRPTPRPDGARMGCDSERAATIRQNTRSKAQTRSSTRSTHTSRAEGIAAACRLACRRQGYLVRLPYSSGLRSA